jgi:RNA polymerase sigma-70 factor, ECF subfamily
MSSKALEFPATLLSAEVVDQTPDTGLILELYDREQVPLYRYLIWLGLDAATAEETVQDAFLKLYEHLLSQGDRTNLRAWLYRVAHNAARNVQTSFRRTKVTALEVVTDPPSASASVEQTLLDEEKELRLKRAMDDLSPAQKSCLVLRSQGLKYREIAETLGLSVSTVAENVQRGLEKLRDMV